MPRMKMSEPEFMSGNDNPWISKQQYSYLYDYINELYKNDELLEYRKQFLKNQFNVCDEVLSGRETLLDNPNFTRQQLASDPEVPKVRGLGLRATAVFIDEPHYSTTSNCNWPNGIYDSAQWATHLSTCQRDLLQCLAGEDQQTDGWNSARHINSLRESSAIWGL